MWRASTHIPQHNAMSDLETPYVDTPFPNPVRSTSVQSQSIQALPEIERHAHPASQKHDTTSRKTDARLMCNATTRTQCRPTHSRQQRWRRGSTYAARFPLLTRPPPALGRRRRPRHPECRDRDNCKAKRQAREADTTVGTVLVTRRTPRSCRGKHARLREFLWRTDMSL